MNENELKLHYDKQYWKWIDTEKIINTHDVNYIKDKFEYELKYYSNMDVAEYTLYVKMTELHKKYKVKTKSTLFGTEMLPEGDTTFIKKIKDDIWIPKSDDDYLNLQPELLLCKDNDQLNRIRNTLADFISTGKNQNNVGRNLYYIVRDKVTLKYLGLITISSDYLDLSCRDDYIGWTRERRTQGMIKHSCVGSQLVPTQPLGYNYVGGKLLSLLLLSEQIQSDYKRIYGDILVMYDTTSLYGSFSQYTRLKYWKKVGSSNGSVILKPRDRTVINLARDWIKSIESKKYWEWFIGRKPDGLRIKRDYINRFFSFCYYKLGIDKNRFVSNHKRGVYVAELYTNTKEFLREEITEDELIPKFNMTIEALTDVWKTQYANKRIKNLVKNDRVLTDILYYDDLLYNGWEYIKEKYLKQVGR